MMHDPIFALPKTNAALVKGLRRLPFTEESRVRIPYVVQKPCKLQGFSFALTFSANKGLFAPVSVATFTADFTIGLVKNQKNSKPRCYFSCTFSGKINVRFHFPNAFSTFLKNIFSFFSISATPHFTENQCFYCVKIT